MFSQTACCFLRFSVCITEAAAPYCCRCARCRTVLHQARRWCVWWHRQDEAGSRARSPVCIATGRAPTPSRHSAGWCLVTQSRNAYRGRTKAGRMWFTYIKRQQGGAGGTSTLPPFFFCGIHQSQASCPAHHCCLCKAELIKCTWRFLMSVLERTG